MSLGKTLGSGYAKAPPALLEKKQHVCLMGFDRCSGLKEVPLLISPGSRQKLSQDCVQFDTEAENNSDNKHTVCHQDFQTLCYYMIFTQLFFFFFNLSSIGNKF